MTPAASPPATYLLEGLVLGLARSLSGQTLSPGGYHAVKLRDLAATAIADHAAGMALLRQLYRLGPTEYVRRELVRLKAELKS